MKVKVELSVRRPPVVAYVTRPDVRDEIERAVVDAYRNEEAVVEVAWMYGTFRYCHAEMPRAKMSPAKVVVPLPVTARPFAPDTVRAVVDAYGNTDAVLEVAV